MVKKLFFTLFVMSAFSCAHAQNSLLERTQAAESSFFSFKMPGLPSSWLSSMPGYMSVLKGTVSDWYERFSQTTAQIKIADHKELIVGACAAGVVSYLAYCAVGRYRNVYWQNEYKKLVLEYRKEEEQFHRLIDSQQKTYSEIRNYIIHNADLNNRLFSFMQSDGTTGYYTLTMQDFMSAVSSIKYDGTMQTHAERLVSHFMRKQAIDEAKLLVSEFEKISQECKKANNKLRLKYESQFKNCRAYLGNHAPNLFANRFSKYVEPLKQQAKNLEAAIGANIGDDSSVLINQLNDVKEELQHLEVLL